MTTNASRQVAARGAITALTHALPLLLLVGMALAAYIDSFAGVFLLDDKLRIVDNAQIRQLWPVWHVVAGSTRPLVELSLALNYAIGGLDPFGYHVFNSSVHIAAGLTLFGIVRRMFESERLRHRYGAAARALAFAIAAIWLVHPLQTASVTYVIQRAEALMGLFFLLTLYCGIRAAASDHAVRWTVSAIVACALGMGTKEVMVSAPILMLLYDRTFISGSFNAALSKRRALYIGLAATWLVLLAALLNMAPDEEQVHIVTGATPWRYLLTQTQVIAHYLRLALWPHPLVFDYAWPLAQHWQSIVPPALVLLALLAATCAALRVNAWPGFWGAWFFLILAPTSSIMPVADVAFEHRMYLPLAAVDVIVVVIGYELAMRAGSPLAISQSWRAAAAMVMLAAAISVLAYATIRRNHDYASELAMWRDTAAKRPNNPRAHVNLGLALKTQGQFGDAAMQYERALALKPDYAEAHNNLGNLFAMAGDFGSAVAHYGEALRAKPRYAEAQLNWGMALSNQQQYEEAIGHYNEALRLNPNHAGAHNSMGIALARQGRLAEAAAHFRTAAALSPDWLMPRENLRRVQAAQPDMR